MVHFITYIVHIKINVKNDLRIKVTNMEPDIDVTAQTKQHQPFH